jgi:DNA-binding CsgD family transcriptional regulator
MFIDMGMNAFAERAGRELVAAGVGGRARAGTSRSTLTPQEDQVAGLARDGLSNAEIAIRLFLSPSTVEWHLKKVFAKLGISSRQALRDALPSPRLGRAGGVARVRRP